MNSKFKTYLIVALLAAFVIFFIFRKVDTGKKIDKLESQIERSEARAELLEKTALSQAAIIAEFDSIVKEKDKVIEELDLEIGDLKVDLMQEHEVVEEMKASKFQEVINNYYPRLSNEVASDLDSAQSVGVIKSTIENKALKAQVELMEIQRINLNETIAARDEIIVAQTIRINLLNDVIAEYKQQVFLHEKKYLALFKKFRRKTWLVRGVVVAAGAALIVTNIN